MDNYRIILANDARFLRTTLRRLLNKTPNMEVVAEINSLDELPKALKETQANWVILSLPEENGLPSFILDEMQRYPHLRVLAVSGDGSHMRLEWVERWDRETGHFSVEDFKELFSITEPHNSASQAPLST